MRLITPVFLLGLLLSSGSLCAEPAGFRSFGLAKHGSLQMSVPHSWNDQMRQRPNDAPPTILLTPEQGYGFNIQVTPLWPVKADGVIPDGEAIKRTVSKAAEDSKAEAVETVIPVKDIEGASGSGYYYTATDRAAKPAEFKYKMQGMLRVGDLVVAFTILSNDGAEAAVADALKMLKSAQQVGAAPH